MEEIKIEEVKKQMRKKPDLWAFFLAIVGLILFAVVPYLFGIFIPNHNSDKFNFLTTWMLGILTLSGLLAILSIVGFIVFNLYLKAKDWIES